MKKLLAVFSVCALLTCTLCSCSDKDKTEDNPLMLTIGTEQLDQSIIQPVYDYFDGFNNDNAELVMTSFIPTAYIEAMKGSEIYENEVKGWQESIVDTHEMWTENHGENPVIEFKEETQNAKLTQPYLYAAKKYFAYTAYDIEAEIEIEEGYEFKFTYTVTGEESSEDGNETACIVKVKDDGWKLIFSSSEVLISYNNAPDANAATETSENTETSETE